MNASRWLGILLLLPALVEAKPERQRQPHRKGTAQAGEEQPDGSTARANPAGRGDRGMSAADKLLAAGRPRQAVQAFALEVARNPEASASWVGWGTALAQLGECSSALDKLWPYTHTRPFRADSAMWAARCSSRLGFADDAVYFDTLAIERKPESVSARSALVVDLDRAGDYVGRDIILEQLSLIDPKRDTSWFAEAAVALRHGDLETFDVIDTLWRREGRSDDEFARLRAISWMDLDDPHKAFAMMHEKRKIKRVSGDRLIIVECLRRMSQPEEALHELEKTVTGRLQGVDAEVLRARVLVDLGRLAEARQLMAPWQSIPDEEAVASRWYLARAENDPSSLTNAAAEWDAIRSSPLRTLEQLVPYASR